MFSFVLACSFVITVMAYLIDPTEGKLMVAFGEFITYLVAITPNLGYFLQEIVFEHVETEVEHELQPIKRKP